MLEHKVFIPKLDWTGGAGSWCRLDKKAANEPDYYSLNINSATLYVNNLLTLYYYLLQIIISIDADDLYRKAEFPRAFVLVIILTMRYLQQQLCKSFQAEILF